MYLYHVLFILINIYGIDCQKKIYDLQSSRSIDHSLPLAYRSKKQTLARLDKTLARLDIITARHPASSAAMVNKASKAIYEFKKAMRDFTSQHVPGTRNQFVAPDRRRCAGASSGVLRCSSISISAAWTRGSTRTSSRR
jgi:hypothetical protein